MSIQEALIKSPRVSISGSCDLLVTTLNDSSDDSSKNENNNHDPNQDKKKRRVTQDDPFNFIGFIKSMKIEPIAFCFSIVAASRFLAMQQMIQDKICLQSFNQSYNYCKILSSAPNDQTKDDILSATSTYTFYYTTIMVIPGLFWCIFVGSWCDKYLGARKLFMILCALSGFVEAVLLVVNAYFMWLDPIYTLIGLIPAYCIGVHYSGYTALYSYLAANTDKKMRAVRFATVEVCANVATPLGSLVAGYLLSMAPMFGNPKEQIFNYIGVYAIEIPAFLFVIVWCYFMIHEQDENISTRKRSLTSTSYQSINNNNNNGDDCINDRRKSESSSLTERNNLIERNNSKMRKVTLKDIFSLDDLKSVFVTIFKKRHNSSVRLIFWSLFVAHFLSCLPQWGFAYISLPFVERLYFWDSSTLAKNRVIGTVLKPFLVMIIVPILSQKFKFNDMQLAIVGTISGICFTTFLSSILNPLGFYLSFFLGSLSTVSLMATRSYVTKLLPKNEVSKALSVIIMLESMMTVLSSSFFVTIFNLTISFYPTLCYHIASLFLIFALIIYMLIDLKG